MTDPICERCGEARSKHARLGGITGSRVDICPTALFLEHQHKAIDAFDKTFSRHCACGASSLRIPGSETWTEAEQWGGWDKP